MTKVYPNATAASAKTTAVNTGIVLTVWKKSLLFNSDGFTVFDKDGNLVFRVDDYYHRSSSDIVLMNASGKSLLTIRRKKWCSLSLSDNWLIYEGETSTNPILSVKKQLLIGSCLARVTNLPAANKLGLILEEYEIEGSYTNKCCAVYDTKRRRRLAEIRRKEAAIGGVAIGFDVFRLVILSEDIMDSAVAMAIVIVLDLMFQSTNVLTNCFLCN
ncbi:protein LURP-one-related 8-like [Impatiens glandulifera]|uniref:protein LURP-one-related 8-like n=1 Tax=Impatiens glandulifera TaxID=253017 RepID=UPI001FB0A15E|nr:protein LURP-one-related 8-like [Impatiens glandulifera]